MDHCLHHIYIWGLELCWDHQTILQPWLPGVQWVGPRCAVILCCGSVQVCTGEQGTVLNGSVLLKVKKIQSVLVGSQICMYCRYDFCLYQQNLIKRENFLKVQPLFPPFIANIDLKMLCKSNITCINIRTLFYFKCISKPVTVRALLGCVQNSNKLQTTFPLILYLHIIFVY